MRDSARHPGYPKTEGADRMRTIRKGRVTVRSRNVQGREHCPSTGMTWLVKVERRTFAGVIGGGLGMVRSTCRVSTLASAPVSILSRVTFPPIVTGSIHCILASD